MPTVILCGLIGGMVGLGVQAVLSPGRLAGIVVFAIAYALSIAVVLRRGVSWMNAVMPETGAAAISFNASQEFLWLDITALISLMAYELPFLIPYDLTASGRASLVVCGATCGAIAIVVRTLPVRRRPPAGTGA